MKDITHWLDNLIGQKTEHLTEDVEQEIDTLKTMLTQDYEQQQAAYQPRAEQDWPALRNRLKKENLLVNSSPSNRFIEFFQIHWKLALSGATATLTAVTLAIMFLFPQQVLLEPQMSASYTLYPHFRGGVSTTHSIPQNNPTKYAADIIEVMNQYNIPYKLDRLPNGWQIEYLLPDTLPVVATNSIDKWPLPLEIGLWHIIHIKDK